MNGKMALQYRGEGEITRNSSRFCEYKEIIPETSYLSVTLTKSLIYTPSCVLKCCVRAPRSLFARLLCYPASLSGFRCLLWFLTLVLPWFVALLCRFDFCLALLPCSFASCFWFAFMLSFALPPCFAFVLCLFASCPRFSF